MGIDERRRQEQPFALQHAVRIRVEVGSERGDHAVVDTHVEDRVDARARIDDACPADDEALFRGRLRVQHHATSSGDCALIATGPVVSRS